MITAQGTPGGETPLAQFGAELLQRYGENLQAQDVLDATQQILDTNLEVTANLQHGPLQLIDPEKVIPGVMDEDRAKYNETLLQRNAKAISGASIAIDHSMHMQKKMLGDELKSETLPDGTPVSGARGKVVVRDVHSNGVIHEDGKPTNTVATVLGELDGINLTDTFTGGHLYVRGTKRSPLLRRRTSYVVRGLIDRNDDYAPTVDIEFR